MKKLLPIKTFYDSEYTIKYECWTAMKLAVALADGRFMPWYIENFIELVMDHHFVTMYHEFGSAKSLRLYDEPLIINEIYEESDIIKRVINTINDDGYINLYYDRYYLEACDYYRKTHYTHDALVYGYDEEKKEIYFFDSEINPKAKPMTIKFEALQEAFQSALKIVKENKEMYTWLNIISLPLNEVYLKPPTPKRKVNITKIYEAINSNLIGGEFECDEYATDNVLFKTAYKSKKTRYGVSIYKGLYDELLEQIKKDGAYKYNPNNIYINGGLIKIAENKNDLIYRLKYLENQRYLKVPDTLLDNVKKIESMLMEIFRITVEDNLTVDVINDLQERFKEVEVLDIIILTEARDLVYEAMHSKRMV